MEIETVTSRHNAYLTHLRKLAASRAYRDECGEYLGDGTKLLEEALRSRAPLRSVLFAEGVEPPALPDGVRGFFNKSIIYQARAKFNREV